MTLVSRWRRIDAEHWIHRLGMLQTTMLAGLAAWTAMTGLLAGVVLAVVPAALAALVGWMTAAWRRDEPWTWPAWLCASGAGAALSAVLVVAVGAGWGSCTGLAVAVLTMVLLLHPDSRERWRARGRAGTRPGIDARAAAGGGRSRPS